MKFTLTSAVLALAGAAQARIGAPSRMDHAELVKKNLEPRTMDWGYYNLTRDYEIYYEPKQWDSQAKSDGISATQLWCTMWHDACVAYAEADNRDEHHQIDCIPTQAGPTIRAYCGGRKKNSDGTWSSKTPLTDNTRGALELTEMHAWIKEKPLTDAKCKAYAKDHPTDDVVC